MQLEPGERSILAYFSDQQQAQQAAQALKERGYEHLQVDSISRYPSRSVYKSYPANLSSMVLGSREYGSQEYGLVQGPLIAADPFVSGMSSPAETTPGYSYLLTLVTGQDKIASALQILQQYGARV